MTAVKLRAASSGERVRPAPRPDGGRLHHVVAREVKATAAPRSADARHLAWLRDQLGDRFIAGAVLHTGPGRFALGERILALPIATIWAA